MPLAFPTADRSRRLANQRGSRGTRRGWLAVRRFDVKGCQCLVDVQVGKPLRDELLQPFKTALNLGEVARRVRLVAQTDTRPSGKGNTCARVSGDRIVRPL